jgi:hypothetical protein
MEADEDVDSLSIVAKSLWMTCGRHRRSGQRNRQFRDLSR